ncbi:MAG: hypothetical protein JSU88_01645 [Nitrospinaceae bacterium]|nr:MAG: hypothetical protein JSU88_01645 [Nitrospinaceae bacterium]
MRSFFPRLAGHPEAHLEVHGFDLGPLAGNEVAKLEAGDFEHARPSPAMRSTSAGWSGQPMLRPTLGEKMNSRIFCGALTFLRPTALGLVLSALRKCQPSIKRGLGTK